MRVPLKTAATVLLCALAGVAQPQVSQSLRPDQAAFRALFEELVETNTTLSSGSCTLAAERMAARLKAAGFADSQLTLFATPDHPKEGGLVAVYPGTLGHRQAAPAHRAHRRRRGPARGLGARPVHAVRGERLLLRARHVPTRRPWPPSWVDTLIRFKQQGYAPTRTVKVALTCGEETNGAFNGVEWLAANRRELIDAEFALNEGGGGDSDGKGKVVGQSVQIGEKTFANFRRGNAQSRRPQLGAGARQRDLPAARALREDRRARVPAGNDRHDAALLQGRRHRSDDAIGKAMVALPVEPARRQGRGDRQQGPRSSTPTCARPAWRRCSTVATRPTRCRSAPAPTSTAASFPAIRSRRSGASWPRVIGDPGVTRHRAAAGAPVAARPRRSMEPIIGPMQKLAAKYWPGLPVVPVMANGYTDATFLGAVGIPTYGIPGMWGDPDGNGAHGLNERIEVRSVYVGRDYLFDLVKAYAD